MKQKKKERDFPYLPAIIGLSAALVVSIVMILHHNTSVKSLILVLSFLVGFYVLGSILRAVLIAVATKEEPEEEASDDLEDIQTNTENVEEIKQEN